ncbi:MAG: murein biosynthesis integral membrane protein MurJ [Candidatus Chisholmbacteria bacterium]|nr:murein biosynthesis integral membrane protein MurJ [Candidatus Chisholmbacteria bacterium]
MVSHLLQDSRIPSRLAGRMNLPAGRQGRSKRNDPAKPENSKRPVKRASHVRLWRNKLFSLQRENPGLLGRGSLFRNGSRLFSREQTNILSAATVITGAVFLAAIVGVIRNRLLNAYFYTPELLPQLDAYWAAFRIPDTIFQLLVIGALSAAFIPVFSKYINADKNEAYHVASATVTVIVFIFALVATLIAIFAHPLSSFITHGFSPNQIDTMANLTRIMIFAQVFFAVSNFLTGIIQAQKRFLVPALAPIMYNVGIILGTVLLSRSIGIYGPAVGVVLGAFLHFAVQLPLSRELGFRLHFVWDPLHQGVKQIARLMGPRTLALSITQLELTVMVYIASALTAGSLTIFYLAQQLMNLPVRLVGLPIGQASFPFLAKETAAEEKKEFTQTLTHSLLQILYVALPLSAILIVLRIPLVRLAYGVKNFPWAATLLTGKVVAILVLSTFAQAIAQILVRAYYARHDTKTPLIIGIVSAAVNITAAFLFVFQFNLGIIGLAFALTLGNIVHGVGLLVVMYQRLGSITHRQLTVPIAKMALSTFLTGISLWIPLRLLDQLVFDTTRTLPLVALTGTVAIIGTGFYLLFSKLLRIKELDTFKELIHRVGNWRHLLSQSQETIGPVPQSQE